MRRLGVVGTVVLDTIRRPESPEPVRALGGIAYSLAAFEAAPPAGWTLAPIVKVGSDAAAELRAFLDRLERVGTAEGVWEVDAPNNRVELVYAADGSRTERLTGGVPAWELEELRPLAARCDALYVNLIAGWEVELDTARRLGEVVSGPTYCDLHSLLLGHEGDGVRLPEVPARWNDWTRCFDYVQMNRDELELLAAEAGTKPWRLARELVGQRPRAVFVTLGREGAAWFSAGGDGPGGSDRGRIPVREPSARGDATGCGDVWGITCFGSLLEGRRPPAAVERANRLAARNATGSGAAALLEVREAG